MAKRLASNIILVLSVTNKTATQVKSVSFDTCYLGKLPKHNVLVQLKYSEFPQIPFQDRDIWFSETLCCKLPVYWSHHILPNLIQFTIAFATWKKLATQQATKSHRNITPLPAGYCVRATLTNQIQNKLKLQYNITHCNNCFHNQPSSMQRIWQSEAMDIEQGQFHSK